jgi:hypothetical protein
MSQAQVSYRVQSRALESEASMTFTAQLNGLSAT